MLTSPLKRAHVDAVGTSRATDEDVLSPTPVSGPVPTDSLPRPALVPEASHPISGEDPPALPPPVTEPVVVLSSEGSLNVGAPSHPEVSRGHPITRAQASCSSASLRSRESPPSWPRGTVEMVKVCV